jgi:hypothetical protein
MRYVVVGVLSLLAGGCAIYDSERGPLVTSSVVVVRTSGYRDDFTVAIEPFRYPHPGAKSTATTTTVVGVIPIPVTHTYIFNETDLRNLRMSVVESLRESKVSVLDLSANPNLAIPRNAVRLGVEIISAGMTREGYDASVPILQTKIDIDSGSGPVSETKFFRGEVKLTVVGSKEDGIRKFVTEVHRRLGGAV